LGVNLVIPPVFLYGFGVLLVSMGGVRAYYLGWRKRPGGEDDGEEAELESEGELDPEGPAAEVARAAVEAEGKEMGEGDVEPVETVPPRRIARAGGDGHRRHLVMGLLYVAMGLFLLVSTWVGQRR
jgi:hypothetical protein